MTKKQRTLRKDIIMEYEGLTFIFDIDGTLCPIKGKDERYEDVVPYKDMVERRSVNIRSRGPGLYSLHQET